MAAWTDWFQFVARDARTRLCEQLGSGSGQLGILYRPQFVPSVILQPINLIGLALGTKTQFHLLLLSSQEAMYIWRPQTSYICLLCQRVTQSNLLENGQSWQHTFIISSFFVWIKNYYYLINSFIKQGISKNFFDRGRDLRWEGDSQDKYDVQ